MNTDQQAKLATGLILGGIAGAVALYLMHQQTRQLPLLKRVGKKISDVGQIVENMDFDCEDITDSFQKRLPNKGDILKNVADWVTTGLKIWKKIT